MRSVANRNYYGHFAGSRIWVVCHDGSYRFLDEIAKRAALFRVYLWTTSKGGTKCYISLALSQRAQNGSALVRISEDLRKCVVFFGVPASKGGIEYGGTGFLVHTPIELCPI